MSELLSHGFLCDRETYMIISVVMITCKRRWLKITETKSFSSQGNISTVNTKEKLCFSQCSVSRFVQVLVLHGEVSGHPNLHFNYTKQQCRGEGIIGNIKISNEGI